MGTQHCSGILEYRLTIAGKLIQGVTFECILDDIRNNMDSSVDRIHLTSRKDKGNIERAYGGTVSQR